MFHMILSILKTDRGYLYLLGISGCLFSFLLLLFVCLFVCWKQRWRGMTEFSNMVGEGVLVLHVLRSNLVIILIGPTHLIAPSL